MSYSEVPFRSLYAAPSRNGIYKPKQFHGIGCRMVNMGELFAFEFISDQEMSRVELTDAELATTGLADGDLLFGRRSLVEAGAGKCSLVVDPSGPLSFESSIIRVRLDTAVANPRFFYYYFRSPEGRGRIRSIVSGTTVKGIRGRDLSSLLVPRTPKSLQDEVAATLWTYDALIENDNRRMTLLEEAARLSYREWFVENRFPGHERAEHADGVPRGWRLQSLDELCTATRDACLPADIDPATPYIGLEHMPRRSISLSDWDTADAVTSSKHRYNEGDILFGKIRPYFHKVGIAFTDGVASSDAIVLRPKTDALRSLVLMTVSSDAFVSETAQRMREGSKMPRADWKQMARHQVRVPPDGLLMTFSESITAITDQLRTLALQNRLLRSARDLILPPLVRGDVRVPRAA
jgi:type I restriction enzyme S subunit